MDQALALVVCRDARTRQLLTAALADAGVGAEYVPSTEVALDLLRTREAKLLVVEDGLHVSPGQLRSRASRFRRGIAPIVLLPDEADWIRARDLLDEGWFDVWVPPFEAGRLSLSLQRTAVRSALQADLERLQLQLRGRGGYQGLIGRSVVMERLRERLERQAGLEAPLLLIGESGSGREFAARSVHDMSIRQGKPFLAVECGSLTDDAAEAELFGFERSGDAGAGRGAGVIEAAAGGSVFLDEVTRLSLPLQARLADALESGRFVARGGSAPVALNVRVFASAGGDVLRAVEDKRFAQALYDRLAASVVEVPALRERPEDISLLAQSFVETICEINDLPTYDLSVEALGVLQGYAWPGNVRELRNVIEQAVIVARGQTIGASDLPRAVREGADSAGAGTAIDQDPDRPFRSAKRKLVEAFELSYLRELMRRHGGNVTAAAHHAGMLRSALQRLLRKYDIKSADYRQKSARRT